MRSTLRQRVKTPEQVAKETSKALAVFKVPAKQKIKVTDPITKKTSIVTLDRTGHGEDKLITALADPKLSRDRKDHELSMYLFSRGAEGASMMLDLMRYKGEHTKETRVFKSQMRFDFEAFIDLTIQHLRGRADRVCKILGVNIIEEMKAYRAWLSLPNNKGSEGTYWDYYSQTRQTKTIRLDRLEALAISEAIFDLDHAQALEDSRTKITRAREAEKGGGIYVDKKGRSYSVNEPELDAIIKADREATSEIEKT